MRQYGGQNQGKGGSLVHPDEELNIHCIYALKNIVTKLLLTL